MHRPARSPAKMHVHRTGAVAVHDETQRKPSGRRRRIAATLSAVFALVAGLSAAGESKRPSRTHRVVHVVVALCDSKHQGIGPVPKALGNGQEPDTNLYWGAMYGVRTFFRKSTRWRESGVAFGEIAPPVLERAVFHQPSTNTWVVADAWDGKHIAAAARAFLSRNIGDGKDAPGLAFEPDMKVYVGHNVLMDVTVDAPPAPEDARVLPAVVLACSSRDYFAKPLARARMHGLLLTTGLMAPEAYTLDAALDAWAKGGDPSAVRDAAAAAYARYQKISVEPARRLFFSQPLDEAVARSVTERAEADRPGLLERLADRATAPVARLNRDRRVIATMPLPEGFTRVECPRGSFARHVQYLPLEEPGSPVRSWTGDVLRDGGTVLAVVDLAPPTKQQQCADVAIRLHAEWLRASGRTRDIAYRSLSNDEIAYAKWLTGTYDVNRAGTRIFHTPGTRRVADTDAEFERYLRYVMTYANSASLHRDLAPVENENDLLPGDLYVQKGDAKTRGIGHVSVVVDVCTDGDGARFYRFAQGYMPAQDMHLPIPAKGEGVEPGWFSLDGYRRHTKAFGRGDFRRFRP